MHVHLTCATPRRSLVVALQAARELLQASGHRVTVAWPEVVRGEDGEIRLGLDGPLLLSADVIVHVSATDEEALPAEVRQTARDGRPVVRWVPTCRDSPPSEAGATCAVNRAEAVADAVARALAATVG